jgi:hypothetical protein
LPVLVRRFLIILLCLFGLGLLVWLRHRSRMPAPGMPQDDDAAAPEPQREARADATDAGRPAGDVVHAARRATAPPAVQDDGDRLLAELTQLRAEVIERVERRPLFMMAEQRGVPYFRLFFMTKPELFEAVLEAEGVPPADVRPSPQTVAQLRTIAAEAYRRHEEIAAEEAAQVGA